MEIENSALYREVEAIITSPAKPVHYAWTAQIHTSKETLDVFRVLSIDIVRDYEGNYADQTILTAVIPAGTYAKRVYPARSNLDITVKRVQLHEVSTDVNTETAAQTERYAATLLDKGDPVLEGNGRNTPTEESLNLSALVEIQFQLVDKAVEQLRMVSIGGIYRKTTTEEVVKAVLTKESQAIRVDGAQLPRGVQMVPAGNQQARDHVIIPHGVKLVDLPQYVHTKCGGLYSAGLGYYLQDGYWYVYPCYDTQRIADTRSTLTLINVPSNKFPGAERTYRVDGSNVIAMATGEVKFSDDSDYRQLNSGNGVRFADANVFMSGLTNTSGNKTTISRAANNSEFVAVKRDNGKNNVQLSERSITANPFVEYSKLAARNGGYLSLVWENSLPAVIYPGLMVKLLYLDAGEVKTIIGVVLKAHHYVHTRGQSLMEGRHYTNTMLSLFVQRAAK